MPQQAMLHRLPNASHRSTQGGATGHHNSALSEQTESAIRMECTLPKHILTLLTSTKTYSELSHSLPTLGAY